MNRIPRVGEKAPQFAAVAFHDGVPVEVRLSQYTGQWVILIFYPGDFTCVCPTEIAALAVKYPAIRELGAEILVVSTDEVETDRRFHERCLSKLVPGGARFPLLSDPGGVIGSMYGVYDTQARLELRSHFIIDPEGIIQSLEMVAAHVGRSAKEMLRQLRALKEHHATGRMMPCGWEPGKPTLAAGVDTGEGTLPGDSWKPRDAF
ncbi:MAG: peroxiredoxin [Deltaproteobacteria bacterium]|nr:peroxiredoxin [Deltaproteobacteria bacterium]